MFEKASRLKLRFNHKGICTVEDLWDIPLRSLDTIYKGLNVQAKAQQEESLLDTKSAADELLDLQIGIIKHVVKVRLQEKYDRKAESEKAEKKQKILGIIAKKQDEALYEMPIDDLTKMVNEM